MDDECVPDLDRMTRRVVAEGDQAHSVRVECEADQPADIEEIPVDFGVTRGDTPFAAEPVDPEPQVCDIAASSRTNAAAGDVQRGAVAPPLPQEPRFRPRARR